MRIPVGNHFLSIEKTNNVWFTAKVTYDKMDARRIFGFSHPTSSNSRCIFSWEPMTLHSDALTWLRLMLAVEDLSRDVTSLLVSAKLHDPLSS